MEAFYSTVTFFPRRQAVPPRCCEGWLLLQVSQEGGQRGNRAGRHPDLSQEGLGCWTARQGWTRPGDNDQPNDCPVRLHGSDGTKAKPESPSSGAGSEEEHEAPAAGEGAGIGLRTHIFTLQLHPREGNALRALKRSGINRSCKF